MIDDGITLHEGYGDACNKLRIFNTLSKKQKDELCALEFCFESIELGDLYDVSQFLKETTSLRALLLTGIGMNQEAAKLIAEGLKHNRTLTHFEVVECEIHTVGFQLLIKTVAAIKTLRTVRLVNNAHCGGAFTIASLIRLSKSMTSLDLSMSAFTEKQYENICIALKNNNTLKRLEMFNMKNMLGNLDRLLHGNTSLTFLNLKRNTVLFERDIQHTTMPLSHLDLSSCWIDGDKLVDLSKRLSMMTDLRSLDLSGNSFTTSQETEPLRECMTRLERLNLSGCDLGCKAFGSICFALDYNTTLISLKISTDTKHINRAVHAVSNMLAQNTTLTELYFNANTWFHNQQVTSSTLNTIPFNTTLTSLSLHIPYVKFNHSTQIFDTFVAQNTTFQRLHLDVYFSELMRADIVNSALATNTTLTDFYVEPDYYIDRVFNTCVKRNKSLYSLLLENLDQVLKYQY